MIELYEVSVGYMEVPIEGVTPLLMHRFGESARDKVEGKQQGKAQRGREPKDIEREVSEAIYRLGDGSVGFPAIAFKNAAVRAAKLCGLAMVDVRTSFHVVGDLLPLRVDGYEVISSRVVVGKGTLDIRYRPAFFPWEVVLPIRFNERAITPEQIINLLEVGGFGVGVGDWRPECSGSYGMFRVKRC